MRKTKTTPKETKTPLKCTGYQSVRIRRQDNIKMPEMLCMECGGTGKTDSITLHWTTIDFDSEAEARLYADRILYDIYKDGSIAIRGDYKIVERKAIVEKKLVFKKESK